MIGFSILNFFLCTHRFHSKRIVCVKETHFTVLQIEDIASFIMLKKMYSQLKHADDCPSSCPILAPPLFIVCLVCVYFLLKDKRENLALYMDSDLFNF